jgi:hypothetical protein
MAADEHLKMPHTSMLSQIMTTFIVLLYNAYSMADFSLHTISSHVSG